MTPPPRDRIRCAVVGLRQGLEAVYALLHHPDFHLKAVCNLSAEPYGWITGAADPAVSKDDFVRMPPVVALLEHLRRSPGRDGIEHVTDYGALLRRSDIDAVLLFVPDRLHAEYSIAALKAGKRVLCTKPMALAVDSAEAVAAEARKRPCAYMVGFHFTYSAFARAVMERIDGGSLGAVRQISFHFDRGQFRPVNRIKANSGGPVVQECCHWFDLLRLLSGGAAFAKVAGFGGRDVHRDTQDIDDNGTILVEYGNRVRASVHFTYFRPFRPPEFLTIVGDRGRIRATFERITLEDDAGERIISVAGNRKLPGIFHEGFYEMCDAFAAMIREEREPYSGWEAGLENILVATCAQQALEEGAVIARPGNAT